MPKIYRISRAGIRLLYKIRHHKGHGIHSPFVFGFITRVIEEKTAYYAYEDITSYLKYNHPDIPFEESKKERLLFKIINHLHPESILEIGVGNGISSLYLTAPSTDITLLAIETNEAQRNIAKKVYDGWNSQIRLSDRLNTDIEKKYDCLSINLSNFKIDYSVLSKYLKGAIHEHSFVIVDGIRTNRKNQILWNRLVKSDQVKISLDLYHLGILFYNKKYYKKNFKLSF